MLPLASTAVGENGRIGAQVEVPAEVLAYLANETFDQIDDLPHRRRHPESVAGQSDEGKTAPDYTGTDVLRGTITGPIVGAADRSRRRR